VGKWMDKEGRGDCPGPTQGESCQKLLANTKCLYWKKSMNVARYLASFTRGNSVMITWCLIPTHSACNEWLLPSSTTIRVSNTDVSVLKAWGRYGGIRWFLLNAWQRWWRLGQQRRLTIITSKYLLIRRCSVQWRYWQRIKVGHWQK